MSQPSSTRIAGGTAEAEFRQRLAALEARTAASAAALAGPQNKPGLSFEGEDDSSPFECNICLELAREPVVTYCGHLYCWPCLYRWLQVIGKCRTCPVCKAVVDKDKVVPIYGRGATSAQDNPPGRDSDRIPQRPAGKPPQLR
uniref:RING-type E3 ubiquitin transferase n=1 Tax=Tetraselmis sp. GSL018 TaxID=582737 RepID=A0A061QI60_9CHLO